MSQLSDDSAERIEAGWQHARPYEGDDREGIKHDVFNAFQAGISWERKRAVREKGASPPPADAPRCLAYGQNFHGASCNCAALAPSPAGEREPADVRIYWHAYHGWMAEWLPADNAKKPNGGQGNYFVVDPAAQPAAPSSSEKEKP
jgi:hypothetical protein